MRAQCLGRFFRDFAQLSERLGGSELDFEPTVVFVLFTPEGAHFRARVTRNHFLNARLRGARWAAYYCAKCAGNKFRGIAKCLRTRISYGGMTMVRDYGTTYHTCERLLFRSSRPRAWQCSRM